LLRVLDLFSGTGAFGIEALSRGADFALFIENGREALGVLNRNTNINVNRPGGATTLPAQGGGTAWKSGAAKGATGRPVPLLMQFLINRAG